MRGDIVSRPPTKEFTAGFSKIDWGKGKKKPVKTKTTSKTYSYGGSEKPVKSGAYSHKNCLFDACPHPEICQSYAKNYCLIPGKKKVHR